MEKLFEHDELFHILVRQKLSNKKEKLMNYVKERRKLYTKNVMRYLNISRPHALNLMEWLGKLPGFKFYRGSRQLRTSSIVMFDEKSIIKDQNEKIKNKFLLQGKVTLHDILELFDVSLTEAKIIAETFIKMHKEYKFMENKIVKNKL